ncbi:MarR family winged helix-turn-helix transcriptional regulator [Sporosarcina jiandibaonis]|uniref:MarR family winged helix-turn-helix transcriptional regulator n=1 Tax=Sporosarcina jiandibaonis TaxID=2715535 RepID=UPI00155510AA|nr:MarR family transcriptional regulator [Sporosarcina jiandibaonis]
MENHLKSSKQDIKLGILLWFRITRFYNKNIKYTNQHLKNWNLTAAQFDLLSNVGKSQPITQQELGEKLVVTKGNITQLLNKLESMDLIRRDREWKTNYISLTNKGKELYNEVVPEQQLFQAEQFNNLDHEEKKQLLHLLKKIQG